MIIVAVFYLATIFLVGIPVAVVFSQKFVGEESGFYHLVIGVGVLVWPLLVVIVCFSELGELVEKVYDRVMGE